MTTLHIVAEAGILTTIHVAETLRLAVLGKMMQIGVMPPDHPALAYVLFASEAGGTTGLVVCFEWKAGH